MESNTLGLFPEGIYREQDGRKIFGKSLSIFIHNVSFHLTKLKIFEDGKIDCWGLVDFEEFKQKVANGWVRTSIPEGSELSIFPLGDYKIQNSSTLVKEEEFIKEVQDVIDELNGRPTTSEKCREMYEGYNEKSTEENKQRLKKAYENVPEHNRCYILGDMDNKDRPIKEAIYS